MSDPEGAAIRIQDNGAYIVTGAFTLVDSQGRPYQIKRAAVALCRCGQSSNKPFCDGTHSKYGFRSAERASPLPQDENHHGEDSLRK